MPSPSDPSPETPSEPQQARRHGHSSLFIGSTEKAFHVLDAFNGTRGHLTIADIARASNLDRSATQRLVYTLEKIGYLRRIPDTRQYGLTSKVLQLSYNYLRANALVDKASPYLLDISRTLGETTNLQELDDTEIVFVARFPGKHLVNVDIAVGSRLPAFCTASGTAILARMEPSQRVEVLQRSRLTAITPYTETRMEELLARIERAAERGYAVITNETVMGDISIAAAITDHRGVAVAAVNIAVPTTRWTTEQVEAQLAQHVQVAATSISKAKFAGYGE